MKLFLFIFVLAFSFILISCGDDDDDDSSSDFINQPIQGMINGNDWQGTSGIAEPSPFEEGRLSIEIAESMVEDVCAEFFLEGLRVLFSVPNEVGTYELDFGNQTITLFDPDGNVNIVVIDGVVEIQTIDDTEGGSVTGRIVGDSDDENFVNGNFTVTYCPE